MFAKNYDTDIKFDYNQVGGFNRYPSDIMAEYQHSLEEGLDIEKQLIKQWSIGNNIDMTSRNHGKKNSSGAVK